MKKTLVMFFVIFTLMIFNYSKQSFVNFDYDNKTHISEVPYISCEYLNHILYSPWKVNGAASWVVTFDELEKDNLIGILRYNNGRYYSVSRLKDGKYVFFLFYEGKDDLILDDGLLAKDFLIDKKSFKEQINIGDHKNTVKKADCNTYDAEVSTYHYFNDKSITQISYKDDIVTDITEWNNTYSVISYLIPQDLNLIIK